MNYHNITTDDMNNGDGLRTVLWVAGCAHHCDDCQNPITWDPDGGIPFDDTAKEELFDKVGQSYIDGVTFSGGDPLFPGNRDIISELAREIKEKFPDKTIWIYTGYLWEEVKDVEAVKLSDVLCDGEFIKPLKDNNAHWVGSTNQRVIDIQQSLKEGNIVIKEEYYGGKYKRTVLS